MMIKLMNVYYNKIITNQNKIDYRNLHNKNAWLTSITSYLIILSLL